MTEWANLAIEEITLKDHWGSGGGWRAPDSEYTSLVVKAVGWVLQEDDEGVVLVGGLSDRSQSDSWVSMTQYVLKSTIIERKVLKEKAPEEGPLVGSSVIS